MSTWRATPSSDPSSTTSSTDSNNDHSFSNRSYINIFQNQSSHNCSILANEILLQILEFINDFNFEFIGGVFMKVCKQWYCVVVTSHPKISLDFSRCKISKNKFDLLFRTKRQNIHPLLLSNVTVLNLDGCFIGKKGLKAITKCEFLNHLTSLNLRFSQLKRRNGLKFLIKSNYMSKLTSLNLSHVDVAENEELDLTNFSHCDTMKNLKSLNLYACRVPISSLQSLFTSEKMKNLSELIVSTPYFKSDDFIRGFVQLLTLQNSYLKHLTILDVCFMPLEGSQIHSLISSENLQHLTCLKCSRSLLDDFGVTKIATSHYMRNLRELTLCGNLFGNDGLKAITTSEWMSQLTSLRASDNKKITAQGAHDLASSPFMKNLTCLRLSRCSEIGHEGISFIASSEYLHQLTDLSLSYIHCGNEGVFHIATSETLNPLKRLSLKGNDIQDLAIQVLSQSPTMKNLTSLKLSGNLIGKESIEVLAAPTSHLNRLVTLELSLNNGLFSTPEVMQMFVNSRNMHHVTCLNLRETIPRRRRSEDALEGHECIRPLFTFLETSRNMLGNLTVLNLNGNHIGDEGVKIISQQCEHWSYHRLTSLDLTNNNITSKGVNFMTASSNFLNLFELILDDNDMDDASAIIIANSHSFKNLTTLSVHGNRIGKEGKEALTQLASQQMPKLIRLILSWHSSPKVVRKYL